MTRMCQKSAWVRAAGVAVTVAASSLSGQAVAASFDIGEFTTVNIDNLFTIGGAIRTQERDHR